MEYEVHAANASPRSDVDRAMVYRTLQGTAQEEKNSFFEKDGITLVCLLARQEEELTYFDPLAGENVTKQVSYISFQVTGTPAAEIEQFNRVAMVQEGKKWYILSPALAELCLPAE